jgi:hypothetical protein
LLYGERSCEAISFTKDESIVDILVSQPTEVVKAEQEPDRESVPALLYGCQALVN